MHFAFDEFAHKLWGVKKPTIVMTDNKALTRFFQSKRIRPKLWNHCDQALQFDFALAHVPNVENPAADYLSRLDINSEDRIHLKLNDQTPVHYIEIDLTAKTPKQDDDEEDSDPEQQQQIETIEPQNSNNLVQTTITTTLPKCNPYCIPSCTTNTSMTTTVLR